MKVSIITVCNNSESTISRTIQNVINQTYSDIEYIIIDGASSDDTVKIINSYYDDRIKVISEPDDGIYYAMNKGIRLATGEIIGIINSDDWYESDTVETVVKEFVKNPDIDVVYGSIKVYSMNGIVSMDDRCFEPSNLNISLPHPSMFARKSLYERIGLYNTDYKLAADHEFFYRLMKNEIKVVRLDKCLANYSDYGLSYKKGYQNIEEISSIANKYHDYLPSGGLEIINKKLETWKRSVKFSFIQDKLSVLDSGCLFERLRIFFPAEKVIVFGYGKYGRRLKAILIQAGFGIAGIWDNRLVDDAVVRPTRNIQKDEFIIISALDVEDQLESQLIGYGFEKGKDYILYSELLEGVDLKMQEQEECS